MRNDEDNMIRSSSGGHSPSTSTTKKSKRKKKSKSSKKKHQKRSPKKRGHMQKIIITLFVISFSVNLMLIQGGFKFGSDTNNSEETNKKIIDNSFSHSPNSHHKQQQNQQPDGQQQMKQQQSDKQEQIDNSHYHIIFSSGCSNKQDWQSYMLFYHAMTSKQKGTITRIVSGCKDEERVNRLREKHEKEIKTMSPNFYLHFTPDYSKINANSNQKFKYFNKPYGVKHWMEHVLGYDFKKPLSPSSLGGNPHDNDIIILLDTDQIILRPITNDFSNMNEKWIPRLSEQQPVGATTKIPNITKVTHGYPMAQIYAYGGQWISKVPNIDKVISHKELPSPVQSISTLDASQYYSVGPPYVVTGHDMYKIVMKWCEFVVPIHYQYPHFLAEMFAYSMAAAHLNIPHQQMGSFAISDPEQNTEFWEPIANITHKHRVCPRDGVKALSDNDGPHVFHYRQPYYHSKWFFDKHRIPYDFFSCSAPLLRPPPRNMLSLPDYSKLPNGETRSVLPPEMQKKHAWALCTIIHAFNEAATYYKKYHCKEHPANFEESLVFFKNMTINRHSHEKESSFEELNIDVGEDV